MLDRIPFATEQAAQERLDSITIPPTYEGYITPWQGGFLVVVEDEWGRVRGILSERTPE